METETKIISYITGVLVLLLALGAFVLSYEAQRDLAQTNGLIPNLARLFPLIVDGFIIVASLSVLRNSLLTESALYAWGLVIAFTVLSVAFNVSHAPDKILARVIAAVPPVALVLSFELFTGQIRSEVTRRGVLMSLDELRDKIKVTMSEHERILSLTEQAQKRHNVKLSELRQERDKLRGEIRELSEAHDDLSEGGDKRQARIGTRRNRVSEMAQAGIVVSDIATAVGVSERTIYRDFDALGIDDDGIKTDHIGREFDEGQT